MKARKLAEARLLSQPDKWPSAMRRMRDKKWTAGRPGTQGEMRTAARRGTQEKMPTGARRRASRINGLLTAACFLAAALSVLCVVGLAFSPVSVRGSLNEALRWSVPAALLVLLRTRVAGGGSLAGGIQLFAAAAVAVSAAAWFGWITGTDYILFTGDERLSASGMRLAGWLQYSNSLGAFMAALLVFQWKILAGGNRLLRWSAALLAAPCFAVLVLTESRGSWAAAGAGLLLGMLLSPRNIRSRWLVSAAGTLPGGAALTGIAYRLGYAAWGIPNAGTPLREAAAWAAAPAVLAVGALFLLQLVSMCRKEIPSDPIFKSLAKNRSGFPNEAASNPGKRGWRSPLSAKPLSWRLLASGGILLAAALLWLPLSPVHRAAASQETGALRLMYYLDALSIAAKAPFLGTGGDSWRSLFRSVQRVPYTGSEVHSGYLDQLMDHGAAGLLLMLLFAAVLLALAATGRKDGAAAPAALLLHAAVDIDMSYGLFWIFLIFLAAGSASMEAGGDAWGTVRREPNAFVMTAKERGAPMTRRREMPRIARRAALLLFACWLAAAAAASQQAGRAVRLREAASGAAG
ncbi:O-antigen ligase family protein, partial [Paenibacillus humicus]